jgi:hypothetical protein
MERITRQSSALMVTAAEEPQTWAVKCQMWKSAQGC